MWFGTQSFYHHMIDAAVSQLFKVLSLSNTSPRRPAWKGAGASYFFDVSTVYDNLM